MSGLKIPCEHCNGDITEYYHERYRGKRGRCPICGVDFPLEWGYMYDWWCKQNKTTFSRYWTI